MHNGHVLSAHVHDVVKVVDQFTQAAAALISLQIDAGKPFVWDF